jgi:predicted CXXCH cytochrome family protein
VRALSGALLFGPAIAWSLVALGGVARTAADEQAWGAVDRRGDVEGSQACAVCHPDQHASWRATYHRTMTQRADGEAVLAPFAGETLDWLGFRATMSRSADGRPHVRVEPIDEAGVATGAPLLDVDVAMTVGSHRYQQYLARLDRTAPGEVWRLPVAWHLATRRWIPINAAFLEPEDARGDADAYLRHVSRWNDNCVLCHNTEPRPGLSEGPAFSTRVGELGIACEACHGPAEAHLRRHADPFRRVLAGGAGDGSIAHPGRLTPRDESGVCGRCHGNRISADVDAVLRHGDGFLPGTDLAAVSRPIFRDSTVRGEALFADRFWPDGTPRLSAYEYQALQLSPCHQGGRPGGLGCNDCHDMHGADPNMQVRAGREGAAACTGCHVPESLSTGAGHGGHGEAVTCQGCHMPRITYGLLEGMISHRIASPRPQAWIGRHDQPDACTQCHVDRSRAWAAQALPRLGFRDPGPLPAAAADEAWASRVALDLHGGDPVQRVLAIHALTRPGVPTPAGERLAWLTEPLDDEYPAVRWFAWRALRQLAGPEHTELVQAYDPHADVAARLLATDALRAALGRGPLTPAQREELAGRQERTILWIGE